MTKPNKDEGSTQVLDDSITAEQIEEIAKEAVQAAVKENIDDVRQKTSDFLLDVMNRHAEERERLRKTEAGQQATRYLRCLAAGARMQAPAHEFAKHWYGEDDKVTEALIQRSLVTDIATGAGVLVPPEFSAEVIELLRPATVVRRFLTNVIPMERGTLDIPSLTGGVAGQYIGEAQAQNAEQPTFGDVALTWKKLKVTVPMSNELVMMSNPRVDTIVRDDMIRGLAQTEDQAFLRSDGSQFKPRGLRSWTLAANVINANGTVNLANVTSDLRDLIQALEGADVRMLQPVWLMAPRSKNYLRTVRDGNGNFAFPEINQNQLWGFPVGWTNSIPTNLGGGGDESEVYLVDFADVVLGESSLMEMEASREATYTNSAGTLVSAWDRDETVIKALMRHDLAVRHRESLAYLDQVTWGV